MFEFSIAAKYLLPRRRQLSAFIISLFAVLVISLVVWLTLIFFSVTSGLEKKWTEKIIAVTAPIQLTPTAAYHQSYYTRIDTISTLSGYTQKTIRGKLESEAVHPHDPDLDMQVPNHWPSPLNDSDNILKDIVKETFSSIHQIPDTTAFPFEIAFSQLRLRLVRNSGGFLNFPSNLQQSLVNQSCYLSSFEGVNPNLSLALLPSSASDWTHLLRSISHSSLNITEEDPNRLLYSDEPQFQKDLYGLLSENIEIHSLSISSEHRELSPSLLPKKGKWQGLLLPEGQLIVPQNKSQLPLLANHLKKEGIRAQLTKVDFSNPPSYQIYLAAGTILQSELIRESLKGAIHVDQVNFHISGTIQGILIRGDLSFNHCDIATFSKKIPSHSNWRPFLANGAIELPYHPDAGYGILLPRQFRDHQVLLGDRGYFAYQTPTLSGVQEQRLPIFVTGFYDPGIFPMGARFIWASPEVTSLVLESLPDLEGIVSQGIQVHTPHYNEIEIVKAQIETTLAQKGLLDFWKVETFREYEFTRPILQQLQSEKHLFSLISFIIILVACSNIISMLVLLVNDKKVEIAILRAMGATSKSIGLIFGFCGLVLGCCSCIIGTIVALLTLKYLNPILEWINYLQGHELFQEAFYGKMLPNEISTSALIWITVATIILSILAGLIPAWKASRLKPADILKSNH